MEASSVSAAPRSVTFSASRGFHSNSSMDTGASYIHSQPPENFRTASLISASAPPISLISGISSSITEFTVPILLPLMLPEQSITKKSTMDFLAISSALSKGFIGVSDILTSHNHAAIVCPLQTVPH